MQTPPDPDRVRPGVDARPLHQVSDLKAVGSGSHLVVRPKSSFMCPKILPRGTQNEPHNSERRHDSFEPAKTGRPAVSEPPPSSRMRLPAYRVWATAQNLQRTPNSSPWLFSRNGSNGPRPRFQFTARYAIDKRMLSVRRRKQVTSAARP